MKSNSLADTYEPQLQKSMKTVLCSRFISEYGFMGGKEVGSCWLEGVSVYHQTP